MKLAVLALLGVVLATGASAQMYVEGEEKCPPETEKVPYDEPFGGLNDGKTPTLYQCIDHAKDAECRKEHGPSAWWNLFLKKCSLG